MLIQRLDGIEEEVRETRKLMERVVRLEERLVSHLEVSLKDAEKLKELDAKVDELAVLVRDDRQFVKGLKKIMWAAITAAAGGWGMYVFDAIKSSRVP